MLSRNCRQCQKQFIVRDEDLAFLDRVSPTFNEIHFLIPPPTLCSDCRRMRRLSWRNERQLYKRTCDGTGKTIVSSIAADSSYVVYDRDYWFSDAWSALKYGQDFDFSKTFAENFGQLQQRVPRFSVQQPERMENSVYCNFASNCKDCYYLFDSDFSRDCYYSNSINHCQDCCDCGFTTECELCYEAVNCKNCYNLRYSQDCQGCSDSFFLNNCIGCQSCFFCTNLKNKQYYYRNIALPRKEYAALVENLNSGSYSAVKSLEQEFGEFIKNYPRRLAQGSNNENVQGDYISNSKNVFDSYDIIDCWDVAYSDFLHRSQNCMDVSSFGEKIEWMYECGTAGLNSHSCAFCFTCIVSCSNLYYCDSVYSSKNCFGCVGRNCPSAPRFPV